MYYDANTGLGTGIEGTLDGGKIAPGQAFYVRAIGPSPALTITEQAKIQDQQTYFREGGEERVSHLYLKLKGGDREDAAIVSFTESAKDEFEISRDGRKMKNIGMFNLSTKVGDQFLAINNLNDAWCSRSIQVSIDDAAPGTYTLYAENLSSLTGVGSIVLKDNYAGNQVDFKESPSYTFEVSSDELSYGSRFEILLDRPELGLSIQPVANAFCNEDGAIVLDRSQDGAVYSVLDKTGKALVAETGTGGELRFAVPASAMSEGLNEFVVQTSFKGCDPGRLSTNAVINYAKAPVIISEDVSICAGETALLQVTSNVDATRYTWYGENGKEIKGASGNTLETSPVMIETFYFVSAENSSGCVGPKQVITVTPVDLQQPELSFKGDTLSAGAQAELYHWSLNGAEIAITHVPYFTPAEAGRYTVTCVTGGCVKMSSEFEITEWQIGKNDFDVDVYPNPTTSDNIFVKGRTSSDGAVSIGVMDVLGRSVYSSETEAEALLEGFQVQPRTPLKAGIYFLILEENSRKRKIRFIIRD
jgi:hypothetical protein